MAALFASGDSAISQSLRPFMRVSRILAAAALAATSAACASITAGTTQSIAVQTSPEQGAQCELRNDKGAWTIPSTPGSTSISKSYDDMTIVCSTATGWKGATSIRSETAGAAFGNIIAGGVIGAAVDMSSGAAYLYPSSAMVLMTRPTEPAAGAPTVDAASAEVVPVGGTRPADGAPAKPATETPVSVLPTVPGRAGGRAGLRRPGGASGVGASGRRADGLRG